MKNMILALTATLCMMSCATSKQAALNDMRNFTTELQENATTYNFRDWRKEQRKFYKIEKRLQQHEYTADEQHEIGEMKGVCLGYFAKGVLDKASNKITQVKNQLQGIVDGIQKALVP